MEKLKDTVGVFLINKDNKILLHLRDNHPSIFMSGMWTGLGGSIEENETAEEAVIRELNEEISFKPKELRYLVRYNHKDRIVDIFFSYVDFQYPSFLPLKEGVALKFYTIEEIHDLYKEGKTNLDIINQINILKSEVLKDLKK